MSEVTEIGVELVVKGIDLNSKELITEMKGPKQTTEVRTDISDLIPDGTDRVHTAVKLLGDVDTEGPVSFS